MTTVIREFLRELSDAALWPADARSNLLDLIQDCGDPELLGDDIRALIRQRSLLDLPPAGPVAHAGLLKCLIALGNRQTPEFWHQQLEILGGEYGALVFSGLIEHGIETAARSLSEVAAGVQDDNRQPRVFRFKRLPTKTADDFGTHVVPPPPRVNA